MYHSLAVLRRCLGMSLFALVFSAGAEVSNPLIFADFSDPDVVRRGDTYYMVSSSFNYMPGVPVLASKDLVNWRRLSYVMDRHPRTEVFSRPQHGKGMWAPCIRYHDGRFWVFMPDPDFGIYVSTAVDPAGPWSEPHLLLPGKGIIDPTPLWDDDGHAYLMHAWARSRAGFNNVLTLHRMSPDATSLLDKGRVVIDGNRLPGFRTLEGPKLYKRNGYYYVFAPAGGVREGWQTVFRSKNIAGPYQHRVTLEQGVTDINGPHQGAWVVAPDGRDWFFHFQDRDAFGRVVHLQPMVWRDDWPLMGRDRDGNGVGEPVLEISEFLPSGTSSRQRTSAGLSFSDEFDNTQLAPQWQWAANWREEWYSLNVNAGSLRLFAQPKTDNLWSQPALLTQMVVGPAFEVQTRIQLQAGSRTAQSGLLLYGYDYAWLGIRGGNDSYKLVIEACRNTIEDCRPQSLEITRLESPEVTVKLKVAADGKARFSYRTAGGDWITPDQPEFTMKQGRWVGARIGLFVESLSPQGRGGYADIEYFRVSVAGD